MSEPASRKTDGNGIEYSGALGKVGISGTNALWLLGFAVVAGAVLWQGTIFRSHMAEQTTSFDKALSNQTTQILKTFTDQTQLFVSEMNRAAVDRSRLESELRRLEDACRDLRRPRTRGE